MWFRSHMGCNTGQSSQVQLFRQQWYKSINKWSIQIINQLPTQSKNPWSGGEGINTGNPGPNPADYYHTPNTDPKFPMNQPCEKLEENLDKIMTKINLE